MRTKTQKLFDLLNLFVGIFYLSMILYAIIEDNYTQAIFFLILLHLRWKDYETYPTNPSKYH